MNIEKVFPLEAIARYEQYCVVVHNCTPLALVLNQGWLSRLDPWVMAADHIRSRPIDHRYLAPNEELVYSRLTEELCIRMTHLSA